MNLPFAVILVSAAAIVSAQTPKLDYQSCDITAQHTLRGELGGSMKDLRQAHISARANVLEADLGGARKARHLTKTQAARLFKQVETIRRGTDIFVTKQGFLSAAERASYERDLDAIAAQICQSWSG